MSYNFEVLTPWISYFDDTSFDPGNHPKLQDDYPHSDKTEGIRKWEDTTGQDSANLVPEPNLYIIKCEADETVLAAIEADATYEVLWSEAIVEETP